MLSVMVVVPSLMILADEDRANAGHISCDLWAHTPDIVFLQVSGPNKHIKFRSEVECNAGHTGRLWNYSQRHRWWGWETLHEKTKVLNDAGDRVLVAYLQCPGVHISEGSWDFRTRALVGVLHLTTWEYVNDYSFITPSGCYYP